MCTVYYMLTLYTTVCTQPSVCFFSKSICNKTVLASFFQVHHLSTQFFSEWARSTKWFRIIEVLWNAPSFPLWYSLCWVLLFDYTYFILLVFHFLYNTLLMLYCEWVLLITKSSEVIIFYNRAWLWVSYWLYKTFFIITTTLCIHFKNTNFHWNILCPEFYNNLVILIQHTIH